MHATVAFTLDTYTSALPAMDKSAPDVVADLILGSEKVGGTIQTFTATTDEQRKRASS